jgi:hypothetical protein
MGLGKFVGSEMPVIDDLGGDIGDKSRIMDSPLAIEEPLVSRQFPLRNFSNNFAQPHFLIRGHGGGGGLKQKLLVIANTPINI